MATNYPNSLDSLTNPTTTDPVNNPSHAIQHANANDAIEALQSKVGTNNSAVSTSLDYRVRQLELNPVTSTANKIEQTVVNNTGSTLLKGQAVYASGSVGASGKLRVSISSNATEAASSKTFGILAENIINGGEGLVVTEGLVESIDTTGANDGDPVWLGVNGAKIYGLANKPSAPAHLVFLGIVVRGGNANNGSIFVKVQNGFELEELHNLQITSLANGDMLSYDSSTGTWKNKTLNNLNIATQTYVDTAVSNLANTAVITYVPIADVGQPDGVASLDPTGKIPDSQIPAGIARDSEVSTAIANLVNSAPSTLDTLNELATALGNDANFSTTITTAIGNKLDSTTAASTYLTQSTASSTYLTQANASTTYAPIASPTFTGTVSGITKNMVGLGNVDNTSDLNKPISTATQNALDLKAALASPTFTGTVILPNNTITNAMLAGSISNDKLTNSSITINGSAVSLGGSTTIDALPSQTSNNGKYLTTNGTAASWATLTIPPGSLYQTTAPSSPSVGQIWIDSDDEVTVFDSNIIRRQTFTATASQTTFTTTVPFVQGYEQVFMNGILLIRTIDYTTPSTTSVLLGSGAAAGDIIDVLTVTNLNSVDTYTQAETDALLAANAYIAPLSISANTNLLAKKRYFVTSASALTLTLPASPALNDEIQILDASGNASTYNITVARNGNLINGNAGNLIIDNNGGWYTLLYTGSTYGWKVG